MLINYECYYQVLSLAVLIIFIYFQMTLNLRKQAATRTNPTQMKSDFMQKHKITVNEPSQTHFSVQGVQAYSPEQIAALKVREERVNANSQKEGEFVKVQAYKIDDELEFCDRPQTATDELKNTIKPKKSKKPELQEAKPQKAKVKPSIRNELGRANQKFVKRDKNLEKKDQYEKRLQELKQKYKKDFGEELKPKKSKKVVPDASIDDQGENNEVNDFEIDEQEGEQCMPANNIKDKSIKTMTKTLKQNLDDSFEEVQWQEKPASVRSSRLNPSTYSQKLGNAVHLLFD